MKVGIIGLGTAGSAAAWAVASRGLSVVAVERGPLSEAGARWVNGVPRWVFPASGLPEPTHPELRASEAPFHLIGGEGPEKVLARSALEVDMRALTSRLQGLAVASGAELREGVRAEGLEGRVLRTDRGPIEADTWIDASGLTGARLLGTPPVDRADLCAAAQEVHTVADPDGARRFLERYGAREGEVVCFTGVAGGYSIVNARVEGLEVGILTGSLPAAGHPGGQALLDDFVKRESWIGPRLFGGSRAIPLRRAWEVIGRGAIAAIGDAAGQVYPAHGSGVGQQLLAADILARALAEGRGCWGYNVDWQRSYGGLLAGSDLFRRFSAGLDIESLRRLMARGILSEPLMRDAMEQRPSRPPLSAALRAAAGMLSSPRLASRLLPVLLKIQWVERHYRRYPSEPSELPRWAERLRRVTGQPAWLSPLLA